MSSSKDDCEVCGICRLFEIGVVDTECDPKCYEESFDDYKNCTDTKEHSPPAPTCDNNVSSSKK